MNISMQGNWTVHVKSKSAAYPQRFIIVGAVNGNGIHVGAVATPPVHVTGTLWSIIIQNDNGSGFQTSATRIKFPTIVGGNYSFDIQSDDAFGDGDFNDLVLTCSTPALADDFIIYGNVSLYSGICNLNPCRPRFVIIDTYSQLLQALENEKLREIITKYYPERVPVKTPPGPPPPYFTPMVINALDDEQIPPKAANLFKRTEVAAKMALDKNAAEENKELKLSDISFDKRVTLSATQQNLSTASRVDVAAIIDRFRFNCHTEPAQNLTLNFAEYDRTNAELAGGSYTGTGNRTNLGSAITDMNGNYIFRFKQTLSEFIHEILYDVAPGENYFVQALPDIIVRVPDSIHPADTIFETAPYFNVQHLKQINICMPSEKVRPASLCFNGNLINGLGRVDIGGTQNTNVSFADLAMSRFGNNNHLRKDGKITVHNAFATFYVDCAAWTGLVDMRGCMFNKKRAKNDPLIERYTIRYSKDKTTWQYVNQDYSHSRTQNQSLANYNGDPVGPFYINAHVPNVGGPGSTMQVVPSYINIQKRTAIDFEDWSDTNLDCFMQLNTTLYDGTDSIPGTVYFLVEGYDAAGNIVPGARDMIALYIHNQAFNYQGPGLEFTSTTLEHLPCNLYRLRDSEMNTPLNIKFAAEDDWGFLDSYRLTIGKCPSPVEVDITSPSVIARTVTDGNLAPVFIPPNTDGMNPSDPVDPGGCPGYTGTLHDFGTNGSVTITVKPSASMGGWLRAGEQFGVVSVGLTAYIKKTNGYNSGLQGPFYSSASFYIERKI